MREEIVEVVEGATVGDLVNLLVARHGDRLKEYILDAKTGKPKQYLQFLLDEKSISSLNGFSTIVREASVFAIIPPVGGGQP